MKYQVLFYLKTNDKVFMNVVIGALTVNVDSFYILYKNTNSTASKR